MHDVNPEVDPQLEGQDGTPAAPDTNRLLEELAAARKRIDELARAYQAAEKDREDFKKRLERERERMIEVEKADVAVTLIEAIDELDLCLRVPEKSALYEGVKLIRDKMLKKLESKGFERVELTDRKFDPNLAEAVDIEVTTNPEHDGLVTELVRAAYVAKGRVVRAGKVKVARYIEPAQA
jgi:molecular chaperone GrpE